MEASDGDSRSWVAQAYASCRLPLLRFLQHRLGNRAEAEDAMQESFTRFFARFGKNEPVPAPDKHRPYLFQIAANLLHDRHRDRQDPAHMVSFGDSELEADALPAPGNANPEHVAASRQRLERLQQALAELPERQREALVLYRFDGLTQDEVAERMQISRRMVVKHLSRAFAYCELRVQYARADQMGPALAELRNEDEA
ncbi:RNA polymerase sigma factor [Pandoraea apista]|nr:RNA polymerase sigma factor [Pandoraea apista]AJZ74898.1 hypothetical protein SG18_27185 [Pandoraea apista]AKH74360.1 hypothetical protein XM39_22310 [Pandoraea apista]AKI62910.1 hypothetical protein AA956_15635 [Pandoraea apista]